MNRRQVLLGGTSFALIGLARPVLGQLLIDLVPPIDCRFPNKDTCPFPAPWDADRQWNLRVDRIPTPSGGERKRVKISGDYLAVSKTEMPSIIRGPADAASNVETLVLDGRVVEISDSIALDSANLKIFSGELIFADSGILTLFGDRSKGNCSLTVVTRTLHVGTDPYLKPINIYFGAKLDGPKISIYAESVVRNGVGLAPQDAALAIWNMVGASDELDVPPTDAVQIVTGVAAKEASAAFWQNEVIWPAEVYAKALRMNAARPFDEEVRQGVERAAQHVGDVVDRTSLVQVATGLPALAARSANQIDSFSHGPNWAPRKSLIRQIEDFSASLGAFTPTGANSSYADDLIEIIASGFSDEIVTPDKLDKLRERSEELKSKAASLDDKITDNVERSKQLQIDFETLKISIENAKLRIQRSALDEEKRLHDAATARQGFAIVGTVAGVATSFIAGPVAGAAVATGFQTAGNIVYAHNTSGINPKSLGEIIEQGTAFYKGMTVVFDNWNAFQDKKTQFSKVRAGEVILRGDPPKPGEVDKRKPYTQTQAAQEVGSAIGDFGKSFAAIVSSLQAVTPQPLSLSEKEKLDPHLQELLELLAANQKRQGELLAELQSFIDQRTSAEAEEEQTAAAIQEILSIKPVNDEARRRWTELARYIWIAEIRNLVQQIYVMKRAYFFETGGELSLVSELADFPASLTAFVDAGAVDILTPGNEVTSADVQNHLREQKQRLLTSSRIVLRAIQTGVDEYLSRNQRKISFERAVEFRLRDRDANRRAFVQAINAQITLLVARGKGGYVFTQPGPLPDTTPVKGSPAETEQKVREPELISLYIPFLIERDQGLNQAPLRFIRAHVASVKWSEPSTNIGDDGIDFTIVHPGYGEVTGSGITRFFDMRESNSVNEVRFKTTSYMLKRRNNAVPEDVENVVGEKYYTYFPARTNYYLRIDVTSLNWRTLPQVEEIVIAWEFFR